MGADYNAAIRVPAAARPLIVLIARTQDVFDQDERRRPRMVGEL